jgi:two-component system, OmpR family, KDP operon response regulator KdpE
MKILAVDDEPQILRTLRRTLGARGHEVVEASEPLAALQALDEQEVDLILLDLGLPGMDGVELIRMVRRTSSIPIVVISVRDQQSDKVSALDAGADDFLTKPFGVDELLARVRAVQRRVAPAEAPPVVVRSGDLEIDLDRRIVTKGGAYLHLTPTEMAILELLVKNPGKLLTHRFVLQQVWGDSQHAQTQYLRVYVAGLRRKLEDHPANPVRIITEPGLGYRWLPEEG